MATIKDEKVQNSIFVVNDEPYCIWEADLMQRNLEFLDGIDADYFDYVINVHLEAQDEKRAAIAIRSALHHAVETFFSLLGAYVQAPDCAYAWIAKCSNSDLGKFVGSVGNCGNELFTKLNIERVSWDTVANAVFSCYMPDTDRNKQTTELFALLWTRLAHDFANQNHIDEYNSIKHGFRVRSGGFGLTVGVEHKYGVAPPQEEMKVLGSSEFGTTFFKVEPIGQRKGDRNLRSRRTSLNWKFERQILLLQLVGMSINNVAAALRIANGVIASSCKFLRPVENSDFERPWQYTPGVISFNMDFVIEEDEIPKITKKQLVEILAAEKQK